MLPAAYAQHYRSTAVNTASPAQLVLMLFDGALRFMGAAHRGFTEVDPARRNEQIHNNLIKTQAILRELQCSLDLAAGGEFAKRMFQLYDYMLTQLRDANLKKAPEPIHVVEELLVPVRDAWSQMLAQATPTAA